MNTKQTIGLGFIFALITALLWGTIPIAVQQVLGNMDVYTLVWYRFVMSAIGLGLILFQQKKIPDLELFKQKKWLWLIFCGALGLGGNFVLYSQALKYLSPTTSQVIAQLSFVGLMLASVFILKEHLRFSQIVGIAILFIGLLLFFNTSLWEILTRLTDYTIGVLFGLAAASVWVIYGLCQKVLLRRLGTQQILWLIYIICAVMFAPEAKPRQILQLNLIQFVCLIYCGLNTVVAYGALAEAMSRWGVAKVSAIITLTPLFTLVFSDLLALIWPERFIFPDLNLIGYIGAVVVVSGAMFVAIGHYFSRHL